MQIGGKMIDGNGLIDYCLGVSRRTDIENFLRAAVKTGLRMQNRPVESASQRTAQGEVVSNGVATLQRIKASLNKRKPTTPL